MLQQFHQILLHTLVNVSISGKGSRAFDVAGEGSDEELMMASWMGGMSIALGKDWQKIMTPERMREIYKRI